MRGCVFARAGVCVCIACIYIIMAAVCFAHVSSLSLGLFIIISDSYREIGLYAADLL